MTSRPHIMMQAHTMWSPPQVAGSARLVGPATFEEDPYLKRLNELLRSERRLLTAYRGSLRRQRFVQVSQVGCDWHHRAALEILDLIRRYRGIPDPARSARTHVTHVVMEACASLPHRLFDLASLEILAGHERRLQTSYKQIMILAPYRDKNTIANLLEGSHNCLSRLQSK